MIRARASDISAQQNTTGARARKDQRWNQTRGQRLSDRRNPRQIARQNSGWDWRRSLLCKAC